MGYKLICFDMDGVIFKCINFWIELHKKFGTYEEGKKLTEEFLHVDYERLVEEVVKKLWKGKDAGPYYELVESAEYFKGVKEVFDYLKEKKYTIAIVSASSLDLARRVEKDYGVDYIFANDLVIKQGHVAGEFLYPIGCHRDKKLEVVQNLCSKLNISMKEAIFVGDGNIDIEACKNVGLSIGFNPKTDELRKVVTHIVESDDLKDIIRFIP